MAIGATNAVPKISAPSKIELAIIWYSKAGLQKEAESQMVCVHSAKMAMSEGTDRSSKVTQNRKSLSLVLS